MIDYDKSSNNKSVMLSERPTKSMLDTPMTSVYGCYVIRLNNFLFQIYSVCNVYKVGTFVKKPL